MKILPTVKIRSAVLPVMTKITAAIDDNNYKIRTQTSKLSKIQTHELMVGIPRHQLWMTLPKLLHKTSVRVTTLQHC